jgi:hypothetical protein
MDSHKRQQLFLITKSTVANTFRAIRSDWEMAAKGVFDWEDGVQFRFKYGLCHYMIITAYRNPELISYILHDYLIENNGESCYLFPPGDLSSRIILLHRIVEELEMGKHDSKIYELIDLKIINLKPKI